MPEIPYSWLQGQPDCYTIADLQAMTDADLSALAAELRGWTLQNVTDPTGNSFLNWVDSDNVGQYSPDEWQPAAHRNQSGELLRWAATQGCYFTVGFGDFNSDVRVRINLERTQYNEREIFLDETIPGNTARAETIAFCAAMLAMEGRLASD